MGSVFTRPVSGVRPGEGEPRTDAMVDEALTIKIEVGGSSSRLAFPSVDGDSVAANTHPVVHRNGVAGIVEDEAGTQGVFECLLLFALVACVVLYTDKKIDLLSMLLTFVLVALLFGLKHGVSLLHLFCRLF